MRKLFLIIILGMNLAAGPAAEKIVNFSGTWILDPAHRTSWNTNPQIRTPTISSNTGPVITRGTPGPRQVDGTAEESLIRWMELEIQIVQTDTEMQITRHFLLDGDERTVVQKFMLDGSQCLNQSSDGRGEFVSRTNWKQNKLVHSGSEVVMVEKLRVEYPVQEEYSLSKDGKKLTLKMVSVTSQGVNNLKMVYNKSAR